MVLPSGTKRNIAWTGASALTSVTSCCPLDADALNRGNDHSGESATGRYLVRRIGSGWSRLCKARVDERRVFAYPEFPNEVQLLWYKQLA